MARGVSYFNEYTPYVIEFIEKKKLSEIGYRFKDISVFKARIFCEISLKFDLIKAEKMKKAVNLG